MGMKVIVPVSEAGVKKTVLTQQGFKIIAESVNNKGETIIEYDIAECGGSFEMTGMI